MGVCRSQHQQPLIGPARPLCALCPQKQSGLTDLLLAVETMRACHPASSAASAGQASFISAVVQRGRRRQDVAWGPEAVLLLLCGGFLWSPWSWCQVIFAFLSASRDAPRHSRHFASLQTPQGAVEKSPKQHIYVFIIKFICFFSIGNNK